MKVAFVHPLKHHIFYSMAGAMEGNIDVVGLFGYYNKNDILDKVLKNTKYGSLIEGYCYTKIDDKVKTSLWIKVLFLLYKMRPEKFKDFYFKQYEKWVIKNLKGVDCIHVLQDYCNEVIRYARHRGIRIVYEQIIAYDFQQFVDKKGNHNTNLKLLHQKENMQMADYILMASDFVATSIENHFPGLFTDKYRVIPYGASVEMFHYHKRCRKSTAPLKVLSVANISIRKGSNYLIEALKSFAPSEVQLTMIGVPDKDGEKMLQDVDGISSIKYVGRVPHTEIYKYFDSNDLFVLPSLAEGSSLSVYEAIASGMPCIVTDNVGSIITNKKDGIIIPIKNTKAIVEAIHSFISTPDLLEKMSDETKRTIAKYTWAEYEKALADFYHGISKPIE